MKSSFRLSIFLAAFFSLLVVQQVAAQDPTPSSNPVTDDQVNAIASQLYCPVCENIPLDVCPTAACAEWRAQIRDMLAQGKNEAEIKTYFVQQYGDRVIGAPPARGINWLVYIVPPVAILIGVYILFRAFKEWRKITPELAQPTTPVESNDEYVRRLEEELRKR
jgi:cytochrome c-type biogenesis protein CcmH